MKSTFLALLSLNRSYCPATLFLVHKITAKNKLILQPVCEYDCLTGGTFRIAGRNGKIPILFSVVAVKNL